MIHYLNLASKSNHLMAQIMLSTLYLDGNHINQDRNKSIALLKKNASLSSFAKNNLGVIYKNGKLLDKSVDKAITLFKEAIDLDNDNYSSFNLAKIYYFGINVEKDAKKSIDLLEKTVSRKFLPAIIFLFYIFCCGKEKDLQNDEKASYYLDEIDGVFSIRIYINSTLHRRLHNFLVEYDLVYSIEHSFSSDFMNFMDTEEL